jgi:hypothetical protein
MSKVKIGLTAHAFLCSRARIFDVALCCVLARMIHHVNRMLDGSCSVGCVLRRLPSPRVRGGGISGAVAGRRLA